jgi:hypothetical protein
MVSDSIRFSLMEILQDEFQGDADLFLKNMGVHFLAAHKCNEHHVLLSLSFRYPIKWSEENKVNTKLVD